jgi:hypothetical protein
MAYKSFYMPSLGYGTPVTTFTKKDCEEMQIPVVNAMLPKMGIALSAPRAVIFGTAQFGGLGLTQLTALQVHTRLQYLLDHLIYGDETGCLMQVLLEYTQLECGWRGNSRAKGYNKYSALLINTIGITEVWENLHTCKATVEVEGIRKSDANKQQDTVIMEALVAPGRFTNKELKEINYCRIYLQALFISDITNLEGNKIEESAGRDQRQVGRQSTWYWPIQKHPTA